MAEHYDEEDDCSPDAQKEEPEPVLLMPLVDADTVDGQNSVSPTERDNQSFSCDNAPPSKTKLNEFTPVSVA